jgi:hypothetical protein
MIKQVNDRHEVEQYVETLRDSLDSARLKNVTGRAAEKIEGEGEPAAKLRAAIPTVDAGPASSGGDVAENVPFLGRDPIVSLLQSSLDLKLREVGVRDTTVRRNLWSKIVHTVESLLHPRRYGPTDSQWVIKVGEAMLERLAKGNHPFNPRPAEHEISDNARIVLVGDWGTGLNRARAVAKFMGEEIAEALANGREVHVVHLGDVYYSGLPEECDRHVLAPGLWPVTVDQARRGVTSWSLNGNHDMYGGGFGYFDRLLADERFSAQRSPDGKSTSFFRLVSPSWGFVGLDTSWDPDLLAEGHRGVLQDPQADFVKAVARESDRKLMLLSHHQMTSVYDRRDADPPTELYEKLRPILDEGRVTAWLWGHEHRCMGFEQFQGVKSPRCIGHGGVPVLMHHKGDVPPPGSWEERGFIEEKGDQWARFGFAILDLDGDRINVRYRDDRGSPTPPSEVFA